jgi:oligoendopeptidase F
MRKNEGRKRRCLKIHKNELTESEQLHELWKQEGLKYVGEHYEKHDFLKYNWSFTPHYFSSPRYYINYLFANLMAISYYQRHNNDPEFDKKYIELMKSGFPDTPVNLLQKHLNLNPFDPAAVEDAMRIFEAKLTELEKLYSNS